MDMVRLGVLIWLILPIPIYGLIRRWYFAQIRKYPSTTSGRIVNILLYYSTGGEADLPGTNVTYAYSVAGTEHTGKGFVEWIIRQPGEEIRVRYNPERPEESRLDDLRDKIQGAAALGIIVFLADLGYLVSTISIGLLVLLAAISIALRRVPQFSQWTPIRTILVSLLCILTGLPFVAIRIFRLVVDDFWNQNFLWALWNH